MPAQVAQHQADTGVRRNQPKKFISWSGDLGGTGRGKRQQTQTEQYVSGGFDCRLQITDCRFANEPLPIMSGLDFESAIYNLQSAIAHFRPRQFLTLDSRGGSSRKK